MWIPFEDLALIMLVVLLIGASALERVVEMRRLATARPEKRERESTLEEITKEYERK